MSVTFSTGFHQIKPGLRVSGDEISVVFVDTYTTGLYAGKKYIHIDLTNEPDLTFVEAGVNGPLETVADVDALYTQLKDAGMTEAFAGFLIDPSDLSSIHIGEKQVSFDFAGHAPYIFSRNPDANATERTKVSHQTWSLPQTEFTGSVALFGTIESPEEIEFQSIEDRLNLNDSQLDQLIASGMWLFATQADFPPAADNHGRVVHSHADGAIFFSHAGTWNQVANEADLQTAMASLASEASTREAADTTLQANIDAEAATRAADDTTEANTRAGADAALSGRLDVLEADPTTAAAVAAGDAATLSSANSYTDTAVSNVIGSAPGVLDTLGEIADAINDDANVYTTLVSQISAVQADVDGNETVSNAADAALSGRIDTLEVDPTTGTAVQAVQDNLDAETGSRASADSALDGRLDVLEADPTTATAVAAVQSDVDQNEADGDAADAALSGRLDVLEADPTTAAAVAAVQADVDQNESDADAADAALSGRIDVLEADPTTQTLLSGEANTRGVADAALSGRLDTLEADPTTATAVAAVQALLDAEEAARTEGDLNAIGTSNEYTDGLLNQYFSGAVTEEKATGYVAVIQTPLTSTEDATGGQFKFDNADVASVTAIAINHDSDAGRIDWLEVFPSGSKLRVTRASDSAVFDFVVTQVGASGTNQRCKNFTVTTSSTGTLAAGDVLSISTVGGPDISVSGDLSAAGDLTVSGTGESTIAGQLTLGNGLTTGRLDTYEVRASILSRFGGVQSNGSTDPDSRVDLSNATYLLLQTDNTDFPSSDNEYVTVELKKGYLKASKDKDGVVFMDLGTNMEPWKKLYLYEGFDIGGTDAVGAVYTHARVEFADNLTKIHNILRGTSINIGNNIELKPAAAGGRVEITGDLIIDASDFTDAANDNAAAAAGVVVGQVYRNGSDLKVRVS